MSKAGKHQVIPRLLSIYLLLSLFISSLGLSHLQTVFAKSEPITPEAATPPVVVHHDETGKVSFLGTESNNPVSVPGADKAGLRSNDRAQVILDTYGSWFGLQNPSQELSLLDARDKGKNNKVLRYQQRYKGIPVMAGEIILNMTGQGQLISMNGEISPDLDLSVTPNITASAAKAIAIAKVGRTYNLSHSALKATIPKLWIFDEQLLLPSTRAPELVWRVEVKAKDGIPVNELVLINAERGGISLQFNQIDTQWSPGFVQEDEPTPTFTDAPTESPTPIPPPTTTPTPENTSTSTETSTPTPTPTALPTATSTNIPTATPTSSKTETSTATPTPLPTLTPTQTALSTATPTETPAATPTETPASLPPQSPALGLSFYVKPGGNDSLDCESPVNACETINGALGKATGGDTIYVTDDIYTGSGTEVVYIDKDITITGGWDSDFSSQTGMSVIDGENSHRGITIDSGITAYIEFFVIQNGYSTDGGGIHNEGTLTINGCTVNGNVAEGPDPNKGGGIYNGGTLTIDRCEISDNLVIYDGEGGGIYNIGTVTIDASSIHHNHVPHIGGGIYSTNSIVTITNTTISYNTTRYLSGGGIFADYSTFTINNSTIAHNSAAIVTGDGVAGGIAFGNGTTATLTNTIIAENDANSNPDCSGGGGLISGGYNLIGNNCNITPSTGDIFDTGARLIPGLIGFPGYHLLYNDSPAIDAGNPAAPGSGGSACEATDQRGEPRPVDGEPNGSSICDIGALEYNPSAGSATTIYVADGSPQHRPPGETFTVPLSAVVTDDVGNPVSGITVIFTAPASGASGTFEDSGTNVTTAVTDSSGVATSSVFTANDQESSYIVAAAASGISGSASFELANLYWYVSTTGNNEYDCLSPSTACESFHGVIDRLDYFSGDTIKVEEGTYSWFYTPGVASDNVINLQTKKVVVLLGGWNTSFTSQVGMTTIDGSSEDTGLGTRENSSGIVERFTFQNGPRGIGNWGTLELRDCVITNNESGIYNTGTLTVQNSSIVNNVEMSGYGSGIYHYSGVLDINNSTISGNVSYGGGAGIYIDGGDITLNNTTITDNLVTSSIQGAGIWNAAGSVSIQNSIVARNYIDNTGDWGDCHGDITSTGYNLVGVDTDCTYSSSTGDLVGTGASPINPFLSPLQDNGGPTLTHALNNGSPAINAGSPTAPGSGGSACEATDQREITRPVDGRCDMGAFEGSISQSYSPWLLTYTANNGTSLPGDLLCTQVQLNCTNGSDPHADGAHQYARDTFNYYSYNHNRNSIDNAGMTVISSVHYDSGLDNAYWNGSQMIFGDAHGYPLADDVVAHELTHGVTEHTSNLFYYYQSGAINESFSDVWGEFVDLTNGAGDDSSGVRWLIGEDVAGQGALRNMKNPRAFYHPDKMTSSYYYEGSAEMGSFYPNGDNGGVHTNNGVNNKAVYLMVDGGSFNGHTVSGVGIPKVAAIYYEAQTNLLTSGSDYKDLYYILQQACSNLLWGEEGITSADCSEVKDALDAVEMNLDPISGYNPEAALCPTGQGPSDIFFDDFESGVGNWVVNNDGSPNDVWVWENGYATSGTHMLYGIDYQGYSPYAEMDAYLSIPATGQTYLHFNHAFGFEDPDYDGALLYYQLMGSSWTDASSLFVDGLNYNGYINTAVGDGDNPHTGRNAFIGDSHGYVSSKYDLSSFAGQNVRFRWRMTTDSSYYDLGWFIDDVRVYTCEDPTFEDVPFDHEFYNYIMALYEGGYTAGCQSAPLMYCPDQIMNRAMSAVFMLRGHLGVGYTPPAEPWDTFADDWSLSDISWAEKWAEGMWEEGLTAGCQTDPLMYCPRRELPRVEAAVFGLRMMHGVSYTPPPGTGTLFADMTDPGYWGTKWAEQAYLDGLLPACGLDNGKPMFCPDDLVDRAWGAYLIVQAKDLLP
ncbi:MAG: M4 family metallopeptidase [Anaerolineales bacterium]|jgi:Zn-dependent metalloprotease